MQSKPNISSSNATVLFVPDNETHVRTFVPVANRLVRRGAEVRFLCRDSVVWPAFRTSAAIEEAALPAVHYEGWYCGDVDRICAWPWQYMRLKKEMQRFLEELQFDVCVFANDSASLFSRLMIHLAKRAGRKTALIQESVRPSERGLSPSVTLRELGLHAVISDALQRLAMKFTLGPFFRKAYGFSGCDVIIASGDAFRRSLTRRGGRETSIVICGQPRFDHIEVSPSPLRPFETTNPPESRTLLFCRQPLNCSRNTQAEFFRYLVRACDQMSNVRLLVKLHPRDEPVKYWRSLLNNETGRSLIDIVDGPRLTECFDQSDAVLVVTSTTCLEAMMRGKPVITVNYLPTTWYLDYARFQAVLSVDSPDQLTQAIRAVLFDEETRSRLVRNAEAVLREELFLLDGKSAERIADLLEKVARAE